MRNALVLILVSLLAPVHAHAERARREERRVERERRTDEHRRDDDDRRVEEDRRAQDRRLTEDVRRDAPANPRHKFLAGAAVLGVGLGAFVIGLGTFASTFDSSGPTQGRSKDETAEANADLRPRVLGGEVVMGLAALAVVSGGVAMIVGHAQSTGKRSYALAISPTLGGASAQLRF